jgi:hypothetical protein
MNNAESSSDFSETEYDETSVRDAGPFRDDPAWHPSLASACDIQGSLGTKINKEKLISILLHLLFNRGVAFKEKSAN